VCEYVWRGDGGIGEDGKNKDVWWSDLEGGWSDGGCKSPCEMCVWREHSGFLHQTALD